MKRFKTEARQFWVERLQNRHLGWRL